MYNCEIHAIYQMTTNTPFECNLTNEYGEEKRVNIVLRTFNTRGIAGHFHQPNTESNRAPVIRVATLNEPVVKQ